jgi:hypothetical protein
MSAKCQKRKSPQWIPIKRDQLQEKPKDTENTARPKQPCIIGSRTEKSGYIGNRPARPRELIKALDRRLSGQWTVEIFPPGDRRNHSDHTLKTKAPRGAFRQEALRVRGWGGEHPVQFTNANRCHKFLRSRLTSGMQLASGVERDGSYRNGLMWKAGQCPKQQCPLYPQKRTLPGYSWMSALCHNRTHASQQKAIRRRCVPDRFATASVYPLL